MTLIWLPVAIVCFLALWLLLEILFAPYGFQDDTGWHPDHDAYLRNSQGADRGEGRG